MASGGQPAAGIAVTILVDSDRVIDALSGRATAPALLAGLRDQGLAVSSITIGEVLDGTYRTTDTVASLVAYRRFLARFAVLDVTDVVADTFAFLRAGLRKQGNLIPDLDLLIAATALVHDLALLTRNERHFARVPGLRLHRPS